MNIDDMKLSKGEKSPCDGCKDRVDDEFGEFYCDIVCQKHTWLPAVLILSDIILALVVIYIVMMREVNNVVGSYSDELAEISQISEHEYHEE